MSYGVETVRGFFTEAWQHHPGSAVHHMSHPTRDAWCGIEWGTESFIGYTTGHRRCTRCRKLGEQQP